MSLRDVGGRIVGAIILVTTAFTACVALATTPFVQRHLTYLHRLPIWWRQKLDVPETFGFLPGQVAELRIPTSDGQRLYAWLVVPLSIYLQNESTLSGPYARNDCRDTIVRLLQQSGTRLVIYFHGNAGTVGQTRRTEAYRMITSGSSDSTFVLAWDYRGFGRSTGTPSETGLTLDALSVIKWAQSVGKVSLPRIVLLAQSLGTAVATAAVEHLVAEDSQTVFAGVILCASFTDAASVFLSYRVGGFLPVFSLLNWSARLQSWFRSRVRDKWDTQGRMKQLVRTSKSLRLTLIAAENDEVIRFTDTMRLFNAVVAQEEGIPCTEEAVKSACTVQDMSEGGSVSEWHHNGRCIRRLIVRYGGHNGIMKWAPVSLEVLRCFQEV